MKPLKKAVCVIGTYTDRKTGDEKKRYLNVGTLLERPDGSLAMKMDAVPVGFDGWVNFYDIDRRPKAEQPAAPAEPAPGPDSFESDIPF